MRPAAVHPKLACLPAITCLTEMFPGHPRLSPAPFGTELFSNLTMFPPRVLKYLHSTIIAWVRTLRNTSLR
jgi:hypothetical protein